MLAALTFSALFLAPTAVALPEAPLGVQPAGSQVGEEASPTLAADDECLASEPGNGTQCAVSALQRRAHKAPAVQRSKHYRLSWLAAGTSFFRRFTFLTEENNHGSAHYLEGSEAAQHGVAVAYHTHAILRAGRADPQYRYKRLSAKIATPHAWTHFLAAVKVSHVPYGCGVWPALFTLAPGAAWPHGGELDILEFVNHGQSLVSFHAGEACRLSQREVNRFGGMQDQHGNGFQCLTHYPDQLGCAPNKYVRNGWEWAHSPGVFAVERTASFLKVFFIPEGSIPGDLWRDAPRPETWGRFVISYYPFAASGCPSSIMGPQRLVLGLGLCGDWASKVWGESPGCVAKTWHCRAVDPLREYAPEQDCCTQFIYDEHRKHGTDDYLWHRAFFNISWVKVYQ